jgi:transcriptional regulator with XRE-family HTH domain
MSRYLLSQRKKVSAQIRAWRGDLTLDAVAVAAGVSRQTVGNWENELVQVPNTEHVFWLEQLRAGFAKAVRP